MRFILLTLLLIIGHTVTGQRYWKHGEIGVSFQPSGYFGDLTPKSTFENLRTGFGASFLGKINSVLSMGFSLGYRTIASADSLNKRLAERNLSFKTSISSLDGFISIDLIELNTQNRFNYIPEPIALEVYSGISLFYFNPQAFDTEVNKWVNLRSLGTEGQLIFGGQGYSKLGIGLVSGLDFKVEVHNGVLFGLGVNFTKTFTDYLDDVSGTYADNAQLSLQSQQAARLADRHITASKSDWLPYNEGFQRGNPSSKDWFYFIKLGFYKRIIWR